MLRRLKENWLNLLEGLLALLSLPLLWRPGRPVPWLEGKPPVVSLILTGLIFVFFLNLSSLVVEGRLWALSFNRVGWKYLWSDFAWLFIPVAREELAFRGTVISGLLKCGLPLLAVVPIQAGLFALAHLPRLYRHFLGKYCQREERGQGAASVCLYMVQSLLGGFFFWLVFFLTGDLRLAIMTHLGYNAYVTLERGSLVKIGVVAVCSSGLKRHAICVWTSGGVRRYVRYLTPSSFELVQDPDLPGVSMHRSVALARLPKVRRPLHLGGDEVGTKIRERL